MQADQVLWTASLDVSFDDKDKKARDVSVGLFGFFVVKTKKLLHFSHLEVVEVQHPEKEIVVVVFASKPPLGLSGASAHDFFVALLKSYDSIFGNSPDRWIVRVRQDLSPEAPPKQKKRMDGFTDVYRACCSFLGLEARDDIVWDVDNVLYPANVRVLDPREFEQPTESKDLVALFKALSHNGHFTDLMICPMSGKQKMEREAVLAAAEVLNKNRSISTLTITDCAPVLSSVLSVLASAMASDNNVLLHLLLPSNGLDDKDLGVISSGIGNMQHGLMTIDLSGNSIKKSIAPLVAAFQRNVRMSDSLSKLNLSNAKLGNEGSSALSAWLSNPNSLRELILRDSNANPLLIGQALCHGSVASLEVLDLSHNKFVKGVSVADLAAFFSTAKRLSAVLLSSTSPSTEQLRDLIRSLSGNAEIERLELDLSGNSLGVVGANLLAIELKQFLSLAVLNCADNGFKDKGLSILCDSLIGNDRLLRLDLSDNFDLVAFRKSKATTSLFAESLGNLVSSETCRVTHLKVAATQKTSQMKGEISPILVDIGSNRTIVDLDVSGQGLEYHGFVALTKMLQLNKTVQKLSLDDNGMDVQCAKALHQSLARNKTLKQLPLPANDVSVLLAKADITAKKEFAATWSGIEAILVANASNSAKPSENSADSAKFVPFARDSNVKVAASLLSHEAETEQIRFAIRVQVQGKLTPEDKTFLAEVDGRSSACVSLASERAKILDRAQHALDEELKRCSPTISQLLLQFADQIDLGIMEALRKNFPSLTEELFHAVEASLKERRFAAGAFCADSWLAAANILDSQLDAFSRAQLRSAVSIVEQELMATMRNILEGQKPLLSVSAPVAIPSSPRSSSPRKDAMSAADLLRKLSADSGAEKIPETTKKEEPKAEEKKKSSSHIRSRSTASSKKSPRTKKLSLVEPSDVKASLHAKKNSLFENALVSPFGIDRMVFGEISTSPKAAAEDFRRKRRPRGPSSMFAAADLAALQLGSDEEI